MNMRKSRLYLAGLVAFLIGIPLTEQAFAQGADVITSSIQLAAAIANSAGASQ
jgi:hypothetical protein